MGSVLSMVLVIVLHMYMNTESFSIEVAYACIK